MSMSMTRADPARGHATRLEDARLERREQRRARGRGGVELRDVELAWHAAARSRPRKGIPGGKS
jgi:hypothetical protein